MKLNFLIAAPLIFLCACAYNPSHITNKYEHAQRAVVTLESKRGFGSGFIVQRTNPQHETKLFIWTAAHVVEGEDKLIVRWTERNHNVKVGESVYSGTVIARDTALDLAVLSFDAPASAVEHVQFSLDPQADALPVGTVVFHVGNWYGPPCDRSVSVGIVSQHGVNVPVAGWPWKIVDQAAIFAFPGSSGGPVFDDAHDTVIGVLVGAVPPAQGISFFVPLRAVHSFAHLKHIEWAVSGSTCPDDVVLSDLTSSAKVPVVTAPAPENDHDELPDEP